LVAEYLRHDSFERYAPFLNDGLDWLDRTGRAAKAFHRAITKLPEPPSPERLGALYAALGLVERHLQHRALPDGLEYTLQGILLHVIAALDAAKRLLPTQAAGGFVEGQARDVLACKLSDFAESMGYPIGASKGVDKSKSDKPSPFVAFIRELQNTVGGTRQATRHLRGQSRKPGANARELNSTKLAGESPALVLKTRVRVVAVIAT
jgi:hypothetical protein